MILSFDTAVLTYATENNAMLQFRRRWFDI